MLDYNFYRIIIIISLNSGKWAHRTCNFDKVMSY